jgi:hypothetical protein
MTKYTAFLVSALLLFGCAVAPDKPRICFAKEPLVAPSTTGELKAERFVMRRTTKGCSVAGIECNLQLRHEPDGNISITVSRAWLDGSPPSCRHPEGGFETYRFTPEGKYLGVVLGL